MKILDFINFSAKWDDKPCCENPVWRDEIYLLRYGNFNFKDGEDVLSFKDLLDREQIFIVSSIYDVFISLMEDMGVVDRFLGLIGVGLDLKYREVVGFYLEDLKLGLDSFTAKSRLLIRIKKDYGDLDIDYGVLNDVVSSINDYLDSKGLDV